MPSVCYLGLFSHPFVKCLANSFIDMGWNVTAIGHAIPAQKINLKREVKQYVIPHGRFGFRYNLLSFLKSEIYFIRKVLKKEKPDILDVQSLALCSKYVPFLHFGPIVISAWSHHGSMNLNKVDYLLQKASVRKAKILTTNCNYDKSILARIFGERHKFISLTRGIDLTIFNSDYRKEREKVRNTLDIGKRSPVVIHTRHVTPFYRVHRIVLSIPKVVKEFPDTIFVFLEGISESTYMRRVKGLVNRLGVERNVRFVKKFLSSREMAIYLNASDIFISIPFDDGVSGSLLEGMACGLIPVLSDLLPYREWIVNGENGFLMKNSQPEEIARVLSYSIQNLQELKKKFSDVNIKMVNQRGDVSRTIKKTKDIYLRLIK